tara:strand:- start:886 stop:1056 length:171 start_codon:yes stop_codon:yes gene_type:complete
MPTRDMAECIGGADVTPASGNGPANEQVASLPCRDPDTRKQKNANFVDSKHRLRHN